MFFSRGFVVLALTEGLRFIYICIEVSSICLFLYMTVHFLEQFVENIIFSLLNCFQTFIENQLIIYMGVYFWPLYLPCSYLPVQHDNIVVIISGYKINLHIVQCMCSNFVLLFQSSFDYCRLLHFHINFRVRLMLFLQNPTEILIGKPLPLWVNLWETGL